MIKIRNLKRKDIKTVEKMIEKFSTKINSKQLFNLLKSSDETINNSKEEKEVDFELLLPIFKDLLKNFMEVIEEDVVVFFADLLGMTVDEYYEQDIDIDIKIIEAIIAQESSGNFFTGASGLFKKILSYVKK